MDLCTLISPLFDLMQTPFNLMFFWAPWVGLQVPDMRTLFGGLIGCTA